MPRKGIYNLDFHLEELHAWLWGSSNIQSQHEDRTPTLKKTGPTPVFGLHGGFVWFMA